MSEMVYCHGCGKQIHVTAVSCPQCGAVQPVAAAAAVAPAVPIIEVNNTLVWVLAFAPLIGLVLEGMVAAALNSDEGAEAALSGNKYWYITLALNIALSYADENLLKKAGVDTGKFKGMVWLVPVYLFQRAKALGQNNAYFVVWLVCFVITLAK